MTTKRITFNLNHFVQDLFYSTEDNPELIDEVVQRYKNFLSRAKEEVKKQSISYVINHTLYTRNQLVKSHIDACHRSNFEK